MGDCFSASLAYIFGRHFPLKGSNKNIQVTRISLKSMCIADSNRPLVIVYCLSIASLVPTFSDTVLVRGEQLAMPMHLSSHEVAELDRMLRAKTAPHDALKKLQVARCKDQIEGPSKSAVNAFFAGKSYARSKPEQRGRKAKAPPCILRVANKERLTLLKYAKNSSPLLHHPRPRPPEELFDPTQVPIQCPYSALTVPIQCPLGKHAVPIHFL